MAYFEEIIIILDSAILWLNFTLIQIFVHQTALITSKKKINQKM